LISKVYFPRLIVPASSVIVGLVDALIGGGLLLIMLLWFNLTPDWRILTLPLFFGVAFAAALGAGLWLSALSVKYRDFRFVVPFMVQLGLYISPVGFSSQLVPEQWRWLYSLNPLVGIIDGFRWAILNGASPIYWPGFVLSIALVGLLFGSGVWYFRQVEDNLADVI
jgi:lipopolysaccharide transport system permease protein